MCVYLWPYFLRVSWRLCLRNSAVCCLMSAWNVSCGNQFPSQAVRPFLGLAGFLTFGENNSYTHGNLTSTMKVYRCRCLLLGQQKIYKQLYTNPLLCRVDMCLVDDSTVILNLWSLFERWFWGTSSAGADIGAVGEDELYFAFEINYGCKAIMFFSHVVLCEFRILMNGFETVSSFVKCFIFWYVFGIMCFVLHL